ncbi:MAG: hypothetical protein A2074_02975 [Candidatus Aquicultor primus]|uniref:Polymerase/histidinol phosphatase N-terminal domain-containing protein n=1 Tax=Candidatus Aquicultor primus TaxID=1797195 RepID=A0A1F2UL85_9ACTN|nr:MAG: hypothetical protein A2074_02975 [Candidatus Aquicultor primus]HCG98268.1 phosphatase [Actinomycetota bacterium]
MPVDLHIHTTASDGSFTPREVVEIASSTDLKTIAIADHDTVAALADARRYGAELGVGIIPAIELSSRYKGKDIHILGYYVDDKNENLLASLERLRASREERARRIVECLQGIGVDIDFSNVLEQAKNASVGRPHIARAMVRSGYVSDFRAAFTQFLKRGAPCFLEKFVYPLQATIEIIHNAGGLAVFAHPGLAKLDEHIDEFIAFGLDGFEAYHVEHSERDTKRYLRLAEKKGLVVTGGSDCHGPVSTHGQRLGRFLVPDEVVDSLSAAAKR